MTKNMTPALLRMMCSRCEGTGKVSGKKCLPCDGTGMSLPGAGATGKPKNTGTKPTPSPTPAPGRSSKPSPPEKPIAKPSPKPAPNTTTTTTRRPVSTAEKLRVLEALAAAPKGLTRSGLREKTGWLKGWSRRLGAPTKGTPGGMEGEGLVESALYENTRELVYIITPAGRKFLKKNGKV